MRNLRALTSLGQPVLVYIICQKLDNNTRKEWERINKKDSPTFLDFLKNKCHILDAIDNKQTTLTKSQNQGVLAHVGVNENSSKSMSYQPHRNCSICKQTNHFSYQCPKLMSLPISERYSELKRLNVCNNCLKFGHNANICN